MRVVLVLLILVAFQHQAKCARILGVFPAPGYSQFLLGDRLMGNLAKRGHQVTMISAHKPKTRNYEIVHVPEMLEQTDEWSLFELNSLSIFYNTREIYKLGHYVANTTLNNPSVKALIESKTAKFDIVIVEQFFSESLMAFATHFNASLVLFSSIGATEWNSHLMGNPSLPSISPISFSPYTRAMSFGQRIHNFFATAHDFVYKHCVAYPQHMALIQEHFPETTADFYEIIHNASLMLLNSHWTTSGLVPLTQNMVEIGGFFIDPQPLHKDIQNFLDTAAQGVILFSLGTNLKASEMSEKSLQGIMRAFAKLPQKILWKCDIDNIPNKPRNVFTSKWLQQSDVLAHPNVQLFITHCGLLSTTEAVHYGVPIIGIPVFGDQKMNMARAAENGIGIAIQMDELNEDTLYAAASQMLNNASYGENARKLSNRMRDTIAQPMEIAMFSIESVLRKRNDNFDENHFRPAAMGLFWHQLYMIDLAACFLLAIVLLGLLITEVKRRVRGQTKKVGRRKKEQ